MLKPNHRREGEATLNNKFLVKVVRLSGNDNSADKETHLLIATQEITSRNNYFCIVLPSGLLCASYGCARIL